MLRRSVRPIEQPKLSVASTVKVLRSFTSGVRAEIKHHISKPWPLRSPDYYKPCRLTNGLLGQIGTRKRAAGVHTHLKLCRRGIHVNGAPRDGVRGYPSDHEAGRIDELSLRGQSLAGDAARKRT